MRPSASIAPVVLALAAATVAVAQGDRSGSHDLKLGDERPALEFHMLAGGKAPTPESLKDRVVVLDFWATWCAPCVGAIPKMNQLHREFAGKPIAFISVTYEPERHVRRFLETHPIDGEVGIDDSLKTFQNFQAWGIPVVYIFGRNGKLVAAVHPDNLTAGVLSAAFRGEVPVVKQSTPWNDPAGAEKYFRENQRELREKESSPITH